MFYASRDDSGYFGKPLEKNTFCDKCLLETHLSQKITMSQNPFLKYLGECDKRQPETCDNQSG